MTSNDEMRLRGNLAAACSIELTVLTTASERGGGVLSQALPGQPRCEKSL